MGIVCKGAHEIISVKHKAYAFLHDDFCMRHNKFGNNMWLAHPKNFEKIPDYFGMPSGWLRIELTFYTLSAHQFGEICTQYDRP